MTDRLTLLVVAATAILGGCSGATTPSGAPSDTNAPGTWAVLAPMTTARQELAVAEVGGKVYAVGGFGDGYEPVGTVEAYDPAANRWEERAPLPIRVHHPAAVSLNGKLYVLGGFTGRVSQVPQDAFFEYDPTANAWRQLAPMPTARGALAAAALDGKIHALGGSQDRPLNVHEVYDPAPGRWTRRNPMPTARDHLAVVSLAGKLFAIGGRQSFFGEKYANVEIYDPAT
ncbi:MAG: hypothetical protein HYV92_14360, partial [Candidatus Rokubacteria bacterium]|nr:hypothetical protein [Candidatus Rokubacteria bacterium]